MRRSRYKLESGGGAMDRRVSLFACPVLVYVLSAMSLTVAGTSTGAAAIGDGPGRISLYAHARKALLAWLAYLPSVFLWQKKIPKTRF